MDEKYVSTEGEVVDVKQMNSFHVLNAFQKNVKAVATSEAMSEEPEAQAVVNIKVLKAEILERMAPKACE